jgi:PAS domain S-box-containing protein
LEGSGAGSAEPWTREVVGPFIEGSPDAVVVIDPDGRMVLVNAQTEALFGYQRSEILGQPVEVLLPERFHKAHVGHRSGYLREPRVRPMGVGLQLSGRRKDGSEFPIDISLAPVEAAAGPLVFASVRDVSDRVRAEEKFRAFLEFAPDAVVLIDPDGLIAVVNSQTESLFGYQRSEILGQPVEVLLPERLRGAHVEHRAEYLADPQVRRMGVGLQLLGLRKDGSEFPVDISLSPLETEAGLLLAADIRDVTDRKRLETIKEEFIRNAAHELRTPLAALAGLGETLALHLREMDESDVTEALAALRRQGERASALVANLLDLSQLEGGRASVRISPVDVSVALRRVLETALAPEGTSVEVRVPEGASVLADPVRLEQLLTNLIVNAYRYGGSRIVVEASEEAGHMLVTVSDNGGGVPVELIPVLFEPFTRGPTSGAVGGSGIGLAISKLLVEAFGGSIWYEARNPHGARFCIRLAMPR